MFETIKTKSASSARKIVTAGVAATMFAGALFGAGQTAQAQSVREEIQSKYSISHVAERIAGFQEKVLGIRSYESTDDILRGLFDNAGITENRPMVDQPGVNAPPVEKTPAPANEEKTPAPIESTKPVDEATPTPTTPSEQPSVSTPTDEKTPAPAETTPAPIPAPTDEATTAPVEPTVPPAPSDDETPNITKPTVPPVEEDVSAPVEPAAPVTPSVDETTPVAPETPAEPSTPTPTIPSDGETPNITKPTVPPTDDSTTPAEPSTPTTPTTPTTPSDEETTPAKPVVRHVTYTDNAGKTLTTEIEGDSLPETITIDGVEMIVADRSVGSEGDITRQVTVRYESRSYAQDWRTEIRVDGRVTNTVNTHVTYNVRYDNLTQTEGVHPTEQRLFESVLEKIRHDYDISPNATITHDGQSIQIAWSTLIKTPEETPQPPVDPTPPSDHIDEKPPVENHSTEKPSVEKVTDVAKMKSIIKEYSENLPTLNSNTYTGDTVNALMAQPNGADVVNSRLNAQFVKRANELRAKLGLSPVSIDESFNARHSDDLKSHLVASYNARDHVESSGRDAMFDEADIMMESMVPTSTIRTLHDVTPEALADYAFKMFIGEWKYLGANDDSDGHLQQVIQDLDGLKWIGGVHIGSMTHEAGRGILANVDMSVYNLSIVMIEYK